MTPNDLTSYRDGSKRPDPLGQDRFFVVVLLALAALIAILWFADPTHQPQGESRVDWPVAQPAKP